MLIFPETWNEPVENRFSDLDRLVRSKMSFGHQLANAPVAIAFTVVIAFRHIPAVRLQSAAPVEISQISTVRKDLAGAMTGGEMC